MKAIHDVDLALPGQIAKAMAMSSARKPLRLVVRSKAPLTRELEQLGYLEALLRLSCPGRDRGIGVLVFEWPSLEAYHSVIRMLEGWSDGCGEVGRCRRGMLKLERRAAAVQGSGQAQAPGVHFKVRFPLSDIPGELLELFDLAARAGLADALQAEIRQHQDQESADRLTPEPPDDVQPRVCTPNPQQAMIDRIVHNAPFDPEVHPHVNPNDEVCKSDGMTYRLVMKRVGGIPKRTWIHVRNGHPDTASLQNTNSVPAEPGCRQDAPIHRSIRRR